MPTFDDMKGNTPSKPAKAKPETVKVGNVTVRIYKRTRPTAIGKSRTLYQIPDYTTGVRRFREFTEHAAARREAELIAGKLASGDATAACMLNADAASYGRAMQLLRPTGASLELAAATFAKCFEILGGDAMTQAATFYARHGANSVTSKPVADVVAELLAAKEARGLSAEYLTDLRYRLGRFAEAFAVDIGSVTTADVQKWLDKLKLAPQTAKNFRTVVGTLFQFAEARGYVFKGGNPVLAVERISANGGSIEIFTPDELTLLLENAAPDFLPILAIGGLAGLRATEIERITWQDVDTASGFITVAAGAAKTKRRRLVPIQPNLSAWLTPYAKRTGLLWQGTDKILRAARADCTKAAGVAWKDNGLRHSYASYRLAQIQNAAQVALELGNSADVVFKHYRELVRPAAAQLWFAVAPPTEAAHGRGAA